MTTKNQKTAPVFIGVTGFTDKKQVLQVAKVKHGPGDPVLAVGVLAALSTIKDTGKIINNRYAQGKNIADIFSHGLPHCINTLHYYTPPSHHHSLLDQLLQATELAGPNLHGIQLNIPWPDPEILTNYQQHHPDKFLILAVGKEALGQAEYSATHVSYKLQQDYQQVIDYVIIDASEGAHIMFNHNKLDDYFTQITKRIPEIKLVLTGGMSSSTVPKIVPFVQKFKNLSIDAEGRLRTAKGAGGDLMIIKEALGYFKNGLKVFRDHRH